MTNITGNSTSPLRSLFPLKFFYSLLLIAGLQALLFLPLYGTKYAEGHFFLSFDQFLNRDNPDLFRWSLDYALIFILILVGFKLKKTKGLIYVLTALYLTLFLFQTYYFISWKIYGEKPVWSYDWALIVRVLPVFMRTMEISPEVFYLILILVIILFFIVLNRLHQFLLKTLTSFTTYYLWITGLLVFILPYFLYVVHRRSENSSNTYPVITWIIQDIKWTFTQDRIKPLPDFQDRLDYTAYYNLPLKSKPNIFLIFVEAYGSIAGAVAPYNQAYWERLELMESRLTARGWQAAATLSNSTILGGRSWLGFTTLISGLRIDNHLAYEKLIRQYTAYPQLIRVLNHLGYHTYRLNTMANFGTSFAKLDSTAIQFYGHKTWTKYSDLPYQGYRYDYFGGIPDQFALNFWDEEILVKNQEPFFLFFITLNTHAPFYLPPPLMDNWKDLNAIKSSPHHTTRSEAGAPVYRYVQDVIYNLSFLEKYILEKGDSNSLFILLGDHQPAGMEYLLKSKTDTYATPIHIISQDTRWIEALKKKGFDSGMSPVFKPGSLLRHEGFYSFFMQTWSEIDSLPAAVIPRYLPHGLQ